MEEQSYHAIEKTQTYVEVLLPLAIPKLYSYYVPEELLSNIQFGVRVEVQFGKSKYYTGIAIRTFKQQTPSKPLKPIVSVLDELPIITQTQYQFWQWISEYYCCHIGEVMIAALPAHLKLSSETILTLNHDIHDDFTHLDDKAYLIAEALSMREEITIDEVRDILQLKTVYPIINRLLHENVIFVKEALKDKYKPKTVHAIRFQSYYEQDLNRLTEAFDLTAKSEKQTNALVAIIQLHKQQPFILKQDVYKLVDVGPHIIKALEKKNIIESYQREVSRLGSYEESTVNAQPLSAQQEKALIAIHSAFDQKEVVLLHGVTGSGKTRVYVELIQQLLANGSQALYLLPEIALTTQIINRLQKVFGDDIAVYHSRMTNNERVELWKAVMNGKKIVLGARSALFLPYQQLDLIIIDEEHDPSFKQYDPAPRYQARDAAIYYGNLQKAKILLGTATPSMESYYNAKQGKYGLVEMPERFGGINMPAVHIIDAKKELQGQKGQIHFTSTLLDALKVSLEHKEQAILFQNRRGFAPYYQCGVCGWSAPCIHCDVSLTYHKYQHHLRCHYCGYRTKLPQTCPECGRQELHVRGFGTEKIEDDLLIYFPEASIARMDLDTTRTKNAYAKIINDFEERRIDILVGTQMVTKGLDFENVGIVSVLSADQLLQFPDFRSNERAFQLMTQVSGRAGRKQTQGKVLIQSFNPAHPVLADVINHDFKSFYQREIQERQAFQYPPFFRLIQITLNTQKTGETQPSRCHL